MTNDSNGNGSKIKINLQSLIQTAIITVILGGGGFFSLSDIKKDAVERELRLAGQQVEVSKALNDRLLILEERTAKLLTLNEKNGTDVEWIRKEIERLRGGR